MKFWSSEFFLSSCLKLEVFIDIPYHTRKLKGKDISVIVWNRLFGGQPENQVSIGGMARGNPQTGSWA
jgi:hypothetical protein